MSMDKPIPKEILDRIEWQKSTTQHYDVRPKGFKPQLEICDDCEEIVETRRVVAKKSNNQLLENHFKIHCLACDRYKNPESGKFDSSFNEVNNYYRDKNKHQE